MSCETRERLWQEYNEALDTFSACVEDSSKAFTAQNFSAKMIASQQANEKCKAARLAWEEHVHEHHCSE